MTVLSSIQEASKLMGLSRPTAVYSSTEAFPVEMSALANESAEAIAKGHDWRLFTTLETITGDGTTTAHDLPDDYDRMTGQEGQVLSTRSRTPLTRIKSLNEWLDMEVNGFTGLVGAWIILGGQIHIKPALTASETAKYYYQSNLIVEADGGTTKTRFDTDTDVFRLPERLLWLALIWRWRSLKTLEYAEDMRNAEIALAEEVSRDKGSRILISGRVRIPDDAELAYPGTISA